MVDLEGVVRLAAFEHDEQLSVEAVKQLVDMAKNEFHAHEGKDLDPYTGDLQ